MSTSVSPSLPSGWQFLEELEGSPDYESTYRVQRAAAANGNRTRLVRIVRFGGDESSARTWYIERLAAIADSPIPYLAPVEFWLDSAHSVGSLESEPVRTLASGANRAASKFSKEAWDLIIEQLLTALAGLHSHREQHGAVRPENISLVREPINGTLPLVSLGGVGTGTIVWLGLAGTEDQREWHYYSCETDQQLPKLGADVDLFALGLTMLEGACGHDANPLRAAQPSDRPADRKALLAAVSPLLSRAKFSTRAKRLIQKLLTDETAERFHDAGKALQWWRQHEVNQIAWIQGYWGLVVVVLAVLLMVFGLRWSQATDEIVTLAQKVSQRDDNLQELSKDNSSLREKYDKLTAENNELLAQKNKKPPGSGPPPILTPEEEAERFWRKAIEGAKTAEDRVKKVQDLICKEKPEPSEAALKKVKSWQNELRDSALNPWRNVDKDFQIELNKFSQAPWDPESKLKTRKADLDAAEQVWTEWANSHKLTFADIQKQATILPSNVIPIVGAWLNATQNRPTWQIKLISATSNDDWGLQRQLYVYAGGAQDGYDAHQWQSWKSFTYTNKAIPFTHKPDVPVQIVFEGGRIWSRPGYCPNLINEKFEGPLPLWLANQKGSIGPSNGNVLYFEIVNCPGPPRRPSALKTPASAPVPPKGKSSKP